MVNLPDFVALSAEKLQCFAEHSQDAFFVGQAQDFLRCEPADFVRLVAGADLLAGVGHEEEADVVVLVGVFDQAGRAAS